MYSNSSDHFDLLLITWIYNRLHVHIAFITSHTFQNECRHLTSDIPEPSSSLKEGFHMLTERDSLLSGALTELAKVRRAAVLRMFINALTRGGLGGTPKPIELSSHDPIRFNYS